jgi:hypothetical protein
VPSPLPFRTFAMRPSPVPDDPPVRPEVDHRVLTALRLLAAGRTAALHLRLDPWEFAIGLAELLTTGLSSIEVRCLMARGLAEHALERIDRNPDHRTFRRIANFALTLRSCFVVTEAGLRLLGQSDAPSAAVAGPTLALPRWDRGRRQLWYGDTLVKWYRVPAASQETILATFQEDGWPPRIDDPLTRVDGQDPQERLHEAVKGLNRGQMQRLLVFRRDGTGEGVTWWTNEGSERPRVAPGNREQNRRNSQIW